VFDDSDGVGLGPGHSEAVYRNALALELRAARPGAVVSMEEVRTIVYRGVGVGSCRADIVAREGSAVCVLELKQTAAAGPAGPACQARWGLQTRMYRRYFGADAALLVVFGPTQVCVVAAGAE
jgi:hypothetical protein